MNFLTFMEFNRRSLVFTEKYVHNYFLCAYHLRREGLTTSSAKRQDYSKPERVTWIEEKLLDMHMAPSSLQVYESYGLILLFMIPDSFNEINDFVAASERSNINGVNGILTDLLYGFQTLFSINFNQLIFKLWFQNKFNILF